MLESDIAAAKGGKPKAKTAMKAAAKRKKIANGDDTDESDNFEPTKALVKPRVPVKPKLNLGNLPTAASPAKRPRCVLLTGSSDALICKQRKHIRPLGYRLEADS